MKNRLSQLSTRPSSVKRAGASYEQEAVTVGVYDSFESLASMAGQWDNFVESVGGEIFLSYDWCRVWWKYYSKNRELKVLVFRSGEELVGIIPLFFEKLWLGPILIQAAKIVSSDFTMPQFSVPIKHVYIREVVQMFFALLCEDNWDIMHIGPIAGLYNNYDELREALEQSFGRSYCVSAKKKSVQTYFRLANTWDKYLANLKKKERQLIRSTYRKIKKERLTLYTELASANNFREKFEAFVQTHQSQWQELGKAGHFGDWPGSFEFHREVASIQQKHGRLRLLEVRLFDDCFAYQYSYKFGNRYFEFLTGRSLSENLAHIDLGRLVFAEQAKRAISEGVQCIDSMRGKYEYKLRMGGELFPTRNLYVVPKKTARVVRVGLFRLFAWLLNFFYYRIWYCKVAHKLAFKRKGLWKIWIRTCELA